jgi:hypothetical protein
MMFLAFLAALVMSLWMQSEATPPVSIPIIVIGVGLAYVGTVGGRVRRAYLVLGALCLIYATLGALNVAFHLRDVLLDGLIGAGLIAAGITDHLLLANTLEPDAGTV